MTGTSHIILGAVVGIVTQADRPFPMNVVAMGCTIAGSMAPDLDHVKSKISRKFPIISWWISKIFGHRKFLHSPLIVLMLWAIFHKSDLGLAFVYGYIAHLVQDFFTKGGIPLLYPLKKRFAIPLVRTAEIMEYILTAVMIYLVFKYL